MPTLFCVAAVKMNESLCVHFTFCYSMIFWVPLGTLIVHLYNFLSLNQSSQHPNGFFFWGCCSKDTPTVLLVVLVLNQHKELDVLMNATTLKMNNRVLVPIVGVFWFGISGFLFWNSTRVWY
jgi:hypothetical protein